MNKFLILGAIATMSMMQAGYAYADTKTQVDLIFEVKGNSCVTTSARCPQSKTKTMDLIQLTFNALKNKNGTYSCPAKKLEVWTSFVETNCVKNCSTEISKLSCPSGQKGEITQTKLNCGQNSPDTKIISSTNTCVAANACPSIALNKLISIDKVVCKTSPSKVLWFDSYIREYNLALKDWDAYIIQKVCAARANGKCMEKKDIDYYNQWGMDYWAFQHYAHCEGFVIGQANPTRYLYYIDKVKNTINPNTINCK